MILGQVFGEHPDVDVSIDFRRLDVGVAQQDLDGPDVHPVRQKVRGEGMPERMGRDAPIDAALSGVSFDQKPEALTGEPRLSPRQKQGFFRGVGRRADPLKIKSEPCAR